MSRELTEKLLKAFVDTGDMHMSYRELAVISAKEIERLLADEREKVREMCAVKARTWYTQHEAGMHGEDDYCFPCSDGDRLATTIRQLDLKLDEGSQEKR